MKRILIAAALLSLAVIPASVSAWGNTGHRLIGMAAVRGLPEELPADLPLLRGLAVVLEEHGLVRPGVLGAAGPGGCRRRHAVAPRPPANWRPRLHTGR